MKLTVRTSAAQFLRQPVRYKQQRTGRVPQSSQPTSQLVSRPIPRGVRGISFERAPSRQCRGVCDLHPQWLCRSRYGHGEFDEREHPRAPAGRSDGGQFVSKNGGGNGSQRNLFEPLMRNSLQSSSRWSNWPKSRERSFRMTIRSGTGHLNRSWQRSPTAF